MCFKGMHARSIRFMGVCMGSPSVANTCKHIHRETPAPIGAQDSRTTAFHTAAVAGPGDCLGVRL